MILLDFTEVQDIDAACRFVQGVVSDAMVPPALPIISPLYTGTKVVSAIRCTELHRKAQILFHFAKGRMIAHYAAAYELDERRVRAAIEKNAKEYEMMSTNFSPFAGQTISDW